MSDYDKLKSQLLARYVAHRCCRHYKDLYNQCMALLAKGEELENANSDKSHLLARCFAEKKELQKRNTELLTYCEKLDEHEATLQTKIEKLEAELAKHQGSTFHPDWSLLTATRDTVKEQQATITELRDEVKRLKDYFGVEDSSTKGER